MTKTGLISVRRRPFWPEPRPFQHDWMNMGKLRTANNRKKRAVVVAVEKRRLTETVAIAAQAPQAKAAAE